ncbi:MAG: YebC/PmpR family DNA-binding transcriptional regulator [Clostridiales bacterium]|nr:YebC/PmpR family DNA-binding transcriptional regulator [Clostridiales bacterium]
MSGHSKWHNIQAKKGKADAARGRIFTKIGREIAVAAKQGSDPNLNSKLADAIAKAKAANMPNDNIIRSIKKASGELSATNYESLTYEGYGAGGSAVIVETLTDNKNRTAGDVRHVFDKCGGAMGTTGCVGFMFDRKGVIVIERTATLTEDDMMELAIECGADDVVTEEDAFVVYTNPNDFSEVRKALEEKNLTFLEAAIQQVPQNKTELSPEDTAKFIKMVDLLEDLDDVQEVWHNVVLPEEEDEE